MLKQHEASRKVPDLARTATVESIVTKLSRFRQTLEQNPGWLHPPENAQTKGQLILGHHTSRKV